MTRPNQEQKNIMSGEEVSPSHQIQYLLDEHKQSLPDDLYLKLCNANMVRHQRQDNQIWVEVKVVYATIQITYESPVILPKYHTTPIRTSAEIIDMEMPLHMDIAQKHWSTGKTCCSVHPYTGGSLHEIMEQQILCEECELSDHIGQPVVTIIAVKRL